MSELYYTEQRLNDDLHYRMILSQQNDGFRANDERLPLDRMGLQGLPHAVGALSLPPQGSWTTTVPVGPGFEGLHATKKEGATFGLYAVAAAVAAYLAFVPMVL